MFYLSFLKLLMIFPCVWKQLVLLLLGLVWGKSNNTAHLATWHHNQSFSQLVLLNLRVAKSPAQSKRKPSDQSRASMIDWFIDWLISSLIHWFYDDEEFNFETFLFKVITWTWLVHFNEPRQWSKKSANNKNFVKINKQNYVDFFFFCLSGNNVLNTFGLRLVLISYMPNV